MGRTADIYAWLAEAAEWWCLLGRPAQPLVSVAESGGQLLAAPSFGGRDPVRASDVGRPASDCGRVSADPDTLLASPGVVAVDPDVQQGSPAPGAAGPRAPQGSPDPAYAGANRSATELFERFTSMLDADAQEVLIGRIAQNPPATLRELGDSLDASHEYIRKVQSRITAKYQQLVAANTALGRLVKTLDTLEASVFATQTLEDGAPALGQTIPGLHVSTFAVLAGFSGAYQVADGWYMKPNRESAVRKTLQFVSAQANQFGTVSVGALAGAEDPRFPLSSEQWGKWLTECGVQVEGGLATLPAGNMADAAAAILFSHGSPLSSDELISRFPQQRSERSLRNQLGADPRFVRVDVDSWGLGEWENKPYEGIRAAIEDKIVEAGGQIALSRLVKLLTEEFSVASASVVSYAASPPFQTRRGTVSRREGEVVAEVAPEATANLYRHGDGWLHRISVQPAHFRGGGSRIPMGVAAALNMKFGGRIDLPGRFGTQHAYWTGQQPRLGTLRRPIEALGLHPGDQMFLHFTDQGLFDVRAVPPLVGDPLSDALSLVGFDASEGEGSASNPLEILSKSLGFTGVLRPINLVSAFEKRGDSDVAALVREAYFGDLMVAEPSQRGDTSDQHKEDSEQPALF